MYLSLDIFNDIELDYSHSVSQCTGMDLEIRPGALELLKALDSLWVYIERLNNDENWSMEDPSEEQLAMHKEIVACFEHAIHCDPYNCATLACRAMVFSSIFGYPEIALHDINSLLRLQSYNRDIWVVASKKVASEWIGEEDCERHEIIPVNGTEYFAFKIHFSEAQLYYARAEMNGILGKKAAEIADLKKAAWLGHEDAIEDLKWL